jgi:hypothetical protein
MQATLSAGGPAEVLRLVRARTRELISVTLSDADALAIACMCGSLEADALLELAHDRVVRGEALHHAHRLALNPLEFAALFVPDAVVRANAAASARGGRRDLASMQAAAQTLKLHDELPESLELRDAIEQALRCTLAEPTQRAAWELPRTRQLVMLASHRRADDDALRCLAATVGEVVASDLRRWDDLRDRIAHEGVDLMHVSGLITTLASTA